MKKRHRRQHFTRTKLGGLKPKVAYSEADAKRIAPHEGREAYHCGACGHWHIGHAPRKNLTNKNAPALLEQPGA